MRTSNANPLQWWLNGTPTFNEKEEPGIDHEDFYLPWNNDDIIRDQFLEETGGDYLLNIKNCKGAIINTLEYVEILEGVYELNFVPANLTTPVISEFIRGYRAKKNNVIPNNFQVPGEWVNSGSGGSWTVMDNTAFVNLTGSGQDSKDLTRMLGQTYNGNVKIKIKFIQSATADLTGIRITLGAADVFFTTAGAGTYEQEEDLFGASDFDSVVMEAFSGDLGTKLITVEYLKIYVGDDVVLAIGDFLDVQPNHNNTKLVRYANKLPFALNQFIDDEVFSLRLPIKFFEERSIEEDESEKLSDGTVDKLSGSVSDQKLIQTDMLPYYIHKKLQRALHCNTIFIDDVYWVKEDKYDLKARPDPWYPFTDAECWLTQKIDGFDTNVYGEGVSISGVFDEFFDSSFDRLTIE